MPIVAKEFSALLYYHLILSGKHKVDGVARALNLSPSTIYKYCEGESTFPVDFLPALYRATRETEFLDFILKDTDQRLAPRPEVSMSGREITLEVLDVVQAVGELSAHVGKAVEDGTLTEIEQKQIERVISKLHSELEHVRQKIRAGKAA